MKLYVSNLDASVSEGDLQKLFSPFGEVNSVKVINDYNTGISRGFAFVEMNNDEDARKAMATLENSSFTNRSIHVQEARPKEDKPKRSFPKRDDFRPY
jgi:RNA recognition motif-containing protein